MRLSEIKKLSKSEQAKELEKAKQRISKAYQKLCETGTWHTKPKGSAGGVLWEINK